MGTTFRDPDSGDLSPVHPHVRGDNAKWLIDPTIHLGSPPRAWGQPNAPPNIAPPIRFTPTCVGTTPMYSYWMYPVQVHPHVRGDNGVFSDAGHDNIGSPPRAWGQLSLYRDIRGEERFTPRAWGQLGDKILFPRKVGSPPRAWGQLLPGKLYRTMIRFTPTCVGTTLYLPPIPPYTPIYGGHFPSITLACLILLGFRGVPAVPFNSLCF